jgi:anaerobic magnesium-protoporphyrin IX monomethyl ester cyclase
MRVLLIAVPLMEWVAGHLVPISMDRIRSTPPLGVYWLAGVLKHHGYEAEVLDLIAIGAIDGKLIRERAGKADLVGISCNTLNWPTARAVTEIIRQEYEDLPIVLGGIHAGGYPEHVLNRCSADYIIQGEGEVPLLELTRALAEGKDVRGIQGLGFRDESGRVVVNPNRSLAGVREVEELPDPDYDSLPYGAYESLSVESARGCKFKCTFCSTKFLGSWRGVCAENFVSRLAKLEKYLDRTRYGVYSIIDDLYTLDIQRVSEITRLLQQSGMEVQATLDARATDLIRGNVIEALAPITNHMLLGAECGYNEGLRRISKGCTVEVLERAAQMLQAAGMSHKTVFSFVIGFPFETRADCEKTIRFASKLITKYNVRIYLQWYNSIPGSAIWEELRQEGKVDLWMYDDFGFFSNKHLFWAGVRLSPQDVKELSNVIRNINAVLLLAKPADDIMQFAPPNWLFHESTLDFPSHGVLEKGVRPPAPAASRGDIAGLVGLQKARSPNGHLAESH